MSTKKRKKEHPQKPLKSGLCDLRKVHKSEIVQEIGRLSIEDLRKTLLASELSRRDGWKNFYESQKEIKTLTEQLDIERKRAKNNCPICCELMTNQTTTSTQFCGHTFHKACLVQFEFDVDVSECPLNCKIK